MSVYKEGFYALELIENQSKRIYPDACDFGAPARLNDPTWIAAKQLFDWYGDKDSRKEIKYETGTTVEATIELLNEWTDGSSYKFKLSYITTRGKREKQDGYFYITPISGVSHWTKKLNK